MKKKDVVQPTKFKISKLTQGRNDWNISQGLSIGCEDKEKRKQLWGKKKPDDTTNETDPTCRAE